MQKASILADRSIVAISGPEARDFLQGLISNDMDACQPGRPIYAALLTPQGKILFDFLIVERDGAFLLDCAKDRAAELMKRLTLYKLRAKVEITLRPDLAVAAIWGGDSLSFLLAYDDPRLATLGSRLIGTQGEIAQAIQGITCGDYAAHRLTLGVPDSADLPPDSVLALDAGFEELHGVSFKKGCYVGQEVTARMKHRATARKRFVIAQSVSAIPPGGTPLESQGRELGTLTAGGGTYALALVRLDRLAEAQESGAAVTAAGEKIMLHRPSWLSP